MFEGLASDGVGEGGEDSEGTHTHNTRHRSALHARQRVFIGDVRGAGFFLGVDFVVDCSTREPATRAASFICSHLKDRHNILTSLDGPGDNVMVIKPPMVFTLADVERLVAAIECGVEAYAALSADDLLALQATPT